MGEYADMLLDGSHCQACGQYIGDGDGFPVTCDDCNGVNKRASNRQWSTQHLVDKGIAFQSKNKGAHLIVESPIGLIDFWPGTGKWIVRSNKKTKRGVRELIKYIEKQPGLTEQQ